MAAALTRRNALAVIVGSVFAGAAGGLQALPARRLMYLSGAMTGEGRYTVAALDEAGNKIFETPLPGRAHGSAVRPGRRAAVIFARRPGTFAVVVDLADGTPLAQLPAPDGRHFYGHGVYSRDGARLFTTENDWASGQGVIGVWDAAAGYRRAGEFPSHGIGPHQVVLLSDGRTLAVANTGIRTHPDTGRTRLNVPDMDPALAYVDSADGALLERHGFSESRRRLLSIRHLDANADGTVCVGLQDQGARADVLPLVAFHRRGEGALQVAAAPPAVAQRMHAYAESVVMDPSGTITAVSCPRGGLTTFWDVTRRTFLTHVDVPDGSGVSPTGRAGEFLITSGEGGAVLFDVPARRAVALDTPFTRRRRWDNHLISA